MFDYVRCEFPVPDWLEVVKDSFQTKSLWCSMDHFTITAAGRLIHHKRRYLLPADHELRPPVHVADIDLDYHGDLAIHGNTPGFSSVSYVVRFTHGTVESIRPLEELTDIHRAWLLDRG